MKVKVVRRLNNVVMGSQAVFGQSQVATLLAALSMVPIGVTVKGIMYTFQIECNI